MKFGVGTSVECARGINDAVKRDCGNSFGIYRIVRDVICMCVCVLYHNLCPFTSSFRISTFRIVGDIMYMYMRNLSQSWPPYLSASAVRALYH